MEHSVEHEDDPPDSATSVVQNASSDAASALPTRKHRPTSSDPPAKRARQTRRNGDWWLPDGSVVLELHGVQFRLYRAHLARKSSFFERLFSEPASDTIDNCPLYVIERGTPDEFAALIKAVDDGLSKDYGFEKPAFKDIIPILRTATYYEFSRAREWAIAVAEYYWRSRGIDDIIKGATADALDALLVARECNVPRILKDCLWELVCEASLAIPPGLPPADMQLVLATRAELNRRWIKNM